MGLRSGGGGRWSRERGGRFCAETAGRPRLCREEREQGHGGHRGKLALPAPSETHSESRPKPAQPWLALGTLSAHTLCCPSDRLQAVGPSFPPTLSQGHLSPGPWAPQVPRAPQARLCPAHLGADVLIGGWADEGEADEEDVLGTEQQGLPTRGSPGVSPRQP